jgi:hypothetical protein
MDLQMVDVRLAIWSAAGYLKPLILQAALLFIETPSTHM